MRKCEDILFEVEEIRKEVTNTWGKLLCQSGAIVLKKPSVLSCFLGILFQASRDVGPGVDKIIKFKCESPFVEICTSVGGIGDMSNIESTKDCIVNFAQAIVHLSPKADILKNRLEELFHEISDSISNWLEQFKEKAGGFMNM